MRNYPYVKLPSHREKNYTPSVKFMLSPAVPPLSHNSFLLREKLPPPENLRLLMCVRCYTRDLSAIAVCYLTSCALD